MSMTSDSGIERAYLATAEPASEKGEVEKAFREWLLVNHWGITNEQIDTKTIAAKATEFYGNAPPASPEVIEGKGQAVTEETCGTWIEEDTDSQPAYPSRLSFVHRSPGMTFVKGRRYMRCPTFPPRLMAKLSWKPNVSGQVATVEGGSSYHIYEVRDDRWIWFYGEGDAFTVRSEREAKEACENHLRKTPPREPFTAPPKPELLVYRIRKTDLTFRGHHSKGRAVLAVSSDNKSIEGNRYMMREVEVIDETTGKPIKE
jgi:hypothetical protein